MIGKRRNSRTKTKTGLWEEKVRIWKLRRRKRNWHSLIIRLVTFLLVTGESGASLNFG